MLDDYSGICWDFGPGFFFSYFSGCFFLIWSYKLEWFLYFADEQCSQGNGNRTSDGRLTIWAGSLLTCGLTGLMTILSCTAHFCPLLLAAWSLWASIRSVGAVYFGRSDSILRRRSHWWDVQICRSRGSWIQCRCEGDRLQPSSRELYNSGVCCIVSWCVF